MISVGKVVRGSANWRQWIFLLLVMVAACSDGEKLAKTSAVLCLESRLTVAAALASSTENASTPASAAIDGNGTSRWSSAFSDPQWLRLDLGASRFVSRVVLRWEAAASQHYELQISDDGSNWRTLYIDNAGDGGVDDVRNLAGQGRYLRVYSFARTTQFGISLFEVEVYGNATPSPACSTPPTACQGARLTATGALASSSETSQFTPDKAIDNNLSTRWSSLFSDPQWLRVDLGAERYIRRVVLRWEAAASRSYDLQVSSNGTAWTNIFSASNRNGGVEDISGLVGRGRYLRVYSHTRTTQFGISLFEVEVYGDTDAQCNDPLGTGGTGGTSGAGGSSGSSGAGAGGRGGTASGGAGAGGASGSGGATGGTTNSVVPQIDGSCLTNPSTCCPAGFNPVLLTPSSDTFQTGLPRQCVVALGGIDTLAVQGGDSIVFGGPDTDIIQAANNNNIVVPGGGIDTVHTGTGDDTVIIFDLCEVGPGENIDMGTGHDVLISPVPQAQLEALGMVLSHVDEVIVQQGSCRSECGAPHCGEHGKCQEGTTPGAPASCKCDPPFTGELCQDTAVPDTDGDGVIDTIDPCVLDAHKSEAGLCGCGKSDVDSDGDTVPDCLDQCPLDPNATVPGPCGCLPDGHVQPQGTRCVVEECSGSRQVSVCDGHGQCGVPDCSPVPGTCFHKVFRDRLYWFCEGPLDWQQAEARCNEEPDRALVKIDDRLESEWLGSVLGNAWVGGNNLGDEADWRWSRHATQNGPLFRSDGLPIPGKYDNWVPGTPQNQHCLALGPDGKWTDQSCSAQRGFICEQPLLGLPAPIDPPCPCQFFPGASCNDCGHDAGGGTGVCIPGDVEWPHLPCQPGESEQACADRNKDAVINKAQACFDNCQVEGTEPGCSENCNGFATPPVDGQRCDDYSPSARALCDLLPSSVDPRGPRCSVKDPSCATGLCGRAVECAALDANNQATPCAVDADCNTAAQQYCGRDIKVCMDPGRKSACDGAINGQCGGYCFGFLGCGTPDPHCAGFDDGLLLSRCNDTSICPDADSIDLNTDPLTDPESNLTEQEFVPTDFFPPTEPKNPPGEFPSAKPAGCGGDGEPACAFPVGGDHPWCKYGVDPNQQPVNRGVSDAQPPFVDAQGRDKQGKGGSGGPISFDFDPNLSINYDLGEPLPLGDSRFGAEARASATADAHFGLFGINGDVNILDAFGFVKAERCGVTADAQLKLFGHDFLPVILGSDADKALKSASTSQAIKDKCDLGIEDFKKVANRATKALRDAQELIRQEKELVANGQRFSPDLCHQLLELGDGVPSDFPSAAAPFHGCDGLSPEDTINLFIRYYKHQVYALIPEQRRLIDDNLPVLAPINIDFLKSVDAVDEVNEARRETQQIANINFAIGPVPMNLTIEAFVQYGLAGNLGLTLAPGKLVDAYHEDGDGEIAKVDASVTPFAGAGVTLFVGVGFDWGALSAKLGISGDVSLGLVSMPIYAAAGLRVKPEPDDRGLPSDIVDMLASGNMIFPPGPPKKFRFDAFYKFGVSADIQDILSGSISAKLRIKFFWFSKTWTKQIAKFESPFDPIHLDLIKAGGDADFSDFGFLGFLRMPLAFVNFAELKEPPPLPPLPDPNTGGTGGTGTGGTGTGGTGTGGTGTSGSGARPPVSLLVDGDDRYKDFNRARVVQLFNTGYCECADAGTGVCKNNLDCCGSTFCGHNDATNVGTCLTCAPPADTATKTGVRCENHGECCPIATSADPPLCIPFTAGGQTYCQACRKHDESVVDSDGQPGPDFGNCCTGLHVYRGPKNNGTDAMPDWRLGQADPVCSACRALGDTCNSPSECCPELQTCDDSHHCVAPPK